MPDTLSLSGKIAIVTGSGRENGIGAGVALALARNGASVAVNYVTDSIADRAEGVCELIRKAGGQGIAIKAAVDTLEGARFLVSETLKGFKTDHIDILVNNAGIASMTDITHEPNPEALSKMLHVNILGPFYMTNSVVPHMPRGSRIVNISSTSVQRGGGPFISVYAGTKAALDSLTWSWAEELGESKGITVNSASPGPVITDIFPPGTEEMLTANEVRDTRAEKRPGTPKDIGDAVLLLVQENARWITGQTISVSGGLTH